jgi:hypothetical protein
VRSPDLQSEGKSMRAPRAMGLEVATAICVKLHMTSSRAVALSHKGGR